MPTDYYQPGYVLDSANLIGHEKKYKFTECRAAIGYNYECRAAIGYNWGSSPCSIIKNVFLKMQRFYSNSVASLDVVDWCLEMDTSHLFL